MKKLTSLLLTVLLLFTCINTVFANESTTELDEIITQFEHIEKTKEVNREDLNDLFDLIFNWIKNWLTVEDSETPEQDLPSDKEDKPSENPSTPEPEVPSIPEVTPDTSKDYGIYTVVSGDTLIKIAKKIDGVGGITSDILMETNGLKANDLIFVGQELKYPMDKVNKPSSSAENPSKPDTPSTTKKFGTYVVVSGDNLTKIAKKIDGEGGITSDILMEANGLKANDLIFVGQELKYPMDKVNFSDSSESDFGSLKSYTVKYGETLSEIARKQGYSVEVLVKLNNIENANSIKAGQVILIPTSC